MKILYMFLILTILLGIGLFIVFCVDLRNAKRGEKAWFWEEKSDEKKTKR